MLDPLVIQTYKTGSCLITSPLVFLLLPSSGRELVLTPWGIISGIFWVPAGTMAVYAVQHAGLALSQGLWSSIIVLVSFLWGAIVFGETPKNWTWMIVAIMFLICGLCGMSYYSLPDDYDYVSDDESDCEDETYNKGQDVVVSKHHPNRINEKIQNVVYDSMHQSQNSSRKSIEEEGTKNLFMNIDHEALKNEMETINTSFPLNHTQNNDIDDFECDKINLKGNYQNSSSPSISHDTFSHTQGHKAPCTYPHNKRRMLGIISAIFNGVWGGSIVAPMHFAPK